MSAKNNETGGRKKDAEKKEMILIFLINEQASTADSTKQNNAGNILMPL